MNEEIIKRLREEITTIKTHLANVVIKMEQDKEKMEMALEEWQNIINRIVNIVKLKDPTVDQLLTKIEALVKSYEISKPQIDTKDIINRESENSE